MTCARCCDGDCDCPDAPWNQEPPDDVTPLNDVDETPDDDLLHYAAARGLLAGDVWDGEP